MLQIQSISKRFGSKLLFEGADAQIGPRSRIALVGPNGSGKTTLFRMILGQEEPDSGRVSRAGRITIGHLAQELPRFEGRTVLEEVLYRAEPPADPDLREEGRREALGKEILSGVGFTQDQFTEAARRAQRRLAHARGALARAPFRARPPLPGRADQPPRSRIALLARGFPQRLPGGAPARSATTPRS